MKQALHKLVIGTRGKGLHEITQPIVDWVKQQAISDGLLTAFCRHTSASLLIQENADPTVRMDLEIFFQQLVPEGADYHHNTEGPDDMPAHIRTALTPSQLSIPVMAGLLALGTWQGIYVFEHRAFAHKREIVLHLLGE